MEKEIEIPWLEPLKNVKEAEPRSEAPHAAWKKYLPYAAVFAVLALAYALKGESPRSEAPSRSAESGLEGLMPLVAVPKGEILRPELLRNVRVARRSLSKTQQLRLLEPADLPRVTGELRAARDLAPERPIFWNDLKLGNAPPAGPRVRVRYGKEARP